MIWSRKPKLLIVGDSAKVHTGFGRVIKEITTHLYNTNQFDITTIGWFDRATSEFVPFPVIPTSHRSVQEQEADKYSQLTFPKAVQTIKPDLVLSVGDKWMTEHIAKCSDRGTFKWISYVPIDGAPLPLGWAEELGKADKLVMYTNFARNVLHGRSPEIASGCEVIYHGTDTETFHPLDKKECKKKLGFDEDSFIFGCVARNQPRKYLPRLIKAFALFYKGIGPDLRSQPEKDKIKLFMHMAVKDCGWDLEELINRYGIKDSVVFTDGLKIGAGVDSDTLNVIYNSFDVHTLPTSGEGWGLSVSESGSCGVPNLVTDWFAHKEFCSGFSSLIPVGDFIVEPLTNIERALVDIHEYARGMDRMYLEPDEYNEKHKMENPVTSGAPYRKMLGDRGREDMLKMDWNIINEKWLELVQSTLGYDGVIKKQNVKVVIL